MSSLRGTRSTQESMARVELRNAICESPLFRLRALLTGSNPTPGIASSSSLTSEAASAMPAIEDLKIKDAPTTDEIKQDELNDLLKQHECEDITIIPANDDISKHTTFED